MAATGEVDRLIKAATLEPSADALHAVARALEHTEVFYRAKVSDMDGKQRVSTPLLRLDDGTHALMVYTSKAHPDLPRQFGGAPWRHALKMALEIPQADWLIVTNLQGDWLPIKKSQIAQLLGTETPGTSENKGPAASLAATNSELGQLISDAAQRSEEDWLAPLLGALRGHELFLKLGDQLSEDGRPKIVTSEVRGVGGLVQAYTSRRRPGIVYGGMRWEAIVDMIKGNSEITGVHIINDNDDWVVLGRAQIQGDG